MRESVKIETEIHCKRQPTIYLPRQGTQNEQWQKIKNEMEKRIKYLIVMTMLYVCFDI